MTGSEFETMVANAFDNEGIGYKWEKSMIKYGSKVGKGKCDFILDHVAIECKCIERLSNLTLPGINPKIHKPYVRPGIKTHQLKFLRHFKGTGGIFVCEWSTKTFYWLSIDDLTRFIISDISRRTLKGIEEHEISFSDFIRKVKLLNEKETESKTNDR